MPPIRLFNPRVFRALERVSTQLFSAEDLETTVSKSLQILGNLVGASGICVFEEGSLRYAWGSEGSPGGLFEEKASKLLQSLEPLMHRGRPFASWESKKELPGEWKELLSERAHGFLFLPAWVHERCWGYFCFFFPRFSPHPTRKSISFIQKLSELLVNAILFRREQQKFRRQERFLRTLHEATEMVLQQEDLSPILQKTAQGLSEVMGASSCMVRSWDPASRCFLPLVPSQELPEQHPENNPVEWRALQQHLEPGKALVVPDASDRKILPENFREEFFIHSFIASSLKKPGGLLGVLLLCFDAPHSFSEEEIRFTQRAAEHISLIFQRTHALQQMKRFALQDPLTQVYNRRGFFELSEHAMHRMKREGLPSCVIMFDVDGFKSFNDRFGHAEGDRVLLHIVSTVKKEIRESDVFGRYGGDEFVLFLPEANEQVAGQVSERILRVLRENPLVIEGKEFPVTLSIGVMQREPEHGNLDALLMDVDRNLYRAKRNGGNRVAIGDGA